MDLYEIFSIVKDRMDESGQNVRLAECDPEAEVFIISGRDRKTGKSFCFSGRIAGEDTYA